MEKFFKNFASYFVPNEDFTIGLSSFKLKQRTVAPPKISKSTKSTLNFNLLHR